jgi:dienelactone hydrolase
MLATLAITASLWQLSLTRRDIIISPITIGTIPATTFKPEGAVLGPVVVIAHGFAGSQQLMQPFATTFAQNGYLAVTFDFAGHGRNPSPLTGSITEAKGATQTLVREVAAVAEYARAIGDGRLAVLGHSMASDIIVRFAKADPSVGAAIAVSMFSPVVTAESPANLLVIVGDWEGMLKKEAIRATSLVSAKGNPPVAEAKPGITYGDFSGGVVRRAAFSDSVEHVGVLYSQDSMREAQAWLDGTFGIVRTEPPYLDARGPWILLLLAGLVLLAWPLSKLLPVVTALPAGAALPWRRLWLPLLLPALATPLVLRVVPTHFLPVLVGDYLAAHFAMYGLITALCLVFANRSRASPSTARTSWGALALGAFLAIAFGFIAIVWPLNSFVTSFVPGPARLLLVGAMLVGTLLFFLSDEWLTRGLSADGKPAARSAYLASKVAFLVSLAIAVALDFERLFFLVIIIPVIVLFLLVYGLFSHWAYRRTGHPFVGGIANAVAFAWAIGVTFPLLAG